MPCTSRFRTACIVISPYEPRAPAFTSCARSRYLLHQCRAIGVPVGADRGVRSLSANNGESRFRDVDEMTAAVMRYPKERLATFSASFGASDVSSYRIVGTKGDLVVEPAYEYSDELGHCLTIGERTTERTFAKSDQFAPELTYFSDCILSRRMPEPSAQEGLADVRIIRALLESAKSGRPVSIERPGEREPMPMPAQAVKYPPIDPPDLFHAKAPS
jgi:predicted dehydrogenase